MTTTENSSTIKVAIADDHALFRRGLADMINNSNDCEVIMQAASGEELMELLRNASAPDVVLLDIKMSGKSGIEILKDIKELNPDLKVLIISMFDETSLIVRAMKNGARGYLLKDTEPEELFQAIKRTMEIGFFFNEKLSHALVQGITRKQKTSQSDDSLTPRLSKTELDILRLICEGMTAGEIGTKVFLSVRTVEGHKGRLLEKTDSPNTPALVAWAFRHGFVE